MMKKGVNRLEQIDKILNLLDKLRIKSEETDKVVLNWHGVPGIGKTRLGFMIGLRCQKKNIPFARIDFDPEENPSALRYAEDPLSIFRDIYAELAAIKLHETEGVDIDSLHEKMEEILKETTAVILFDTTEKADKETLFWVEKFIIGPLCLTGRCVIIWTGRFPRVWRRFEIRQRAADPEKLASLNRRFTEEQIGSSGTWIYKYTFGHPLANERIAEAMATLEKEPGDKEKIKSLLHDFIDKFIFRGISQRLNRACRILSLIRQFDVMFLEKILVEFAGDYFPEETDYMIVVGELRSTSLAEWNTTLKGFSLDDTIRRFLARYLQLTEGKTFMAIGTRAVRLYAEWIALNPENRSVYFKEKLFHLINIGKIQRKTKNDIAAICRDAIDQYVQQSRATRPALMQLHTEMEHDAELREVAGPKVFQNMMAAIDFHMGELEREEAECGGAMDKTEGGGSHA